MAKSAQRIEARRLRKKKGLGIGVIAKELDVSKSSISRWCRDIQLTEKQIKRLINNSERGLKKGCFVAARLKREEQIERENRYKRIGRKKIGELSTRELFLVGAALYWAEGAKKHRYTIFANSDPGMILIFIRWLKESIGVNREDIYCHVSINQDHRHRIEKIERYWSRVTGIHRDYFKGVNYKKVKNKKFYANFNNHYGTLFIKVRKSTNINYEILGYIDGLKRNV